MRGQAGGNLACPLPNNNNNKDCPMTERRCVRCGGGMSHKRHGAIYCCETCKRISFRASNPTYDRDWHRYNPEKALQKQRKWKANNPQYQREWIKTPAGRRLVERAKKRRDEAIYGTADPTMSQRLQRDRYARARELGYRSGLEVKIARELEEKGVPFAYEENIVHYTRPARRAKYTPDIELDNGIIVELKGRFVTADRQKHLLIKEQHPDLDIRFLFSNPNTRISKQSKTTYAMWCDKHGFLYAKATIPDAWLKETPNPVAIEALEKAGMK